MANQEKLDLVQNILKEQVSPISIGELSEILGNNVAERSLRRWLEQLVAQGYVTRLGSKRGTRYQSISTHTEGDIFSAAAFTSLQYVRQPIFKREPAHYHDEWINAYRPNETYYLSLSLRRALFNQGKRQDNHEPAGTYAHKIYHRLLIDLTYNSSRLEGNTYSLLETQRLILEGESADGKLDLEKVMILNHKEAIRHLVDTAPILQIHSDEICTLHYLLADGLVEKKYAGQVRDHGVRIGASTYTPYEDRFRLEQQLIKITSLAAAIDDPFEQSFFLLVHIAYLQAFIDVNKRTARLSANIPLIKNNFVPLSFNEIEKDDYNSAMISIYELNDTLPLAELYHYSYVRSCQQYNSSVIALGFDRIRIQYRQQLREIITKIITQGIIGVDIKKFVHAQTKILIQSPDQEAVMTSILSDLQNLSPARIAGMGITPQQLETWHILNNKTH